MLQSQKNYGTDFKILEKGVADARYKNLPEKIQVSEYEVVSKFKKFQDAVYSICAIVGIKETPDPPTMILLEKIFSEQYGLQSKNI